MSDKKAMAIEVIVRQVIAAFVDSDGFADAWETYAEIGEYDWEEVTEAAKLWHPYPIRAEYDAAYRLLADRAEVEP